MNFSLSSHAGRTRTARNRLKRQQNHDEDHTERPSPRNCGHPKELPDFNFDFANAGGVMGDLGPLENDLNSIKTPTKSSDKRRAGRRKKQGGMDEPIPRKTRVESTTGGPLALAQSLQNEERKKDWGPQRYSGSPMGTASRALARTGTAMMKRFQNSNAMDSFRRGGDSVKSALFGGASMETKKSREARNKSSSTASHTRFTTPPDDDDDEVQVLDMEEQSPSLSQRNYAEDMFTEIKQGSNQHTALEVDDDDAESGPSSSASTHGSNRATIEDGSIVARRRSESKPQAQQPSYRQPKASLPSSSYAKPRTHDIPRVHFGGAPASNSSSPDDSARLRDAGVTPHPSAPLRITKQNNVREKPATRVKPATKIEIGSAIRGVAIKDGIRPFSSSRSLQQKSQSPERQRVLRGHRELDDDGMDDDLVDTDDDDPAWTEQTEKQNKKTKKRSYGRKSTGVSPKDFHAKKSSEEPNWAMRPTTRQSARKNKKKNVEIDLISSSSEEDEVIISPSKANSWQSPGRDRDQFVQHTTRRHSHRVRIGAVRIAIGKKIFNSDCQLSFEPGGSHGSFLKLLYKSPKGPLVEHKIRAEDNSIEELKYYVVDEDNDAGGDESPLSSLLFAGSKSNGSESSFDESEQMSFLALRIKPNKENGLATMTKSYLQSLDPDHSRPREAEMKYIVVEVRSNNDFNKMLQGMRKDHALGGFVNDAAKLDSSEIATYAKALIEESSKEKKRRESSMGSPRALRTRKRNRAGDVDDADEVLLVYPFGVGTDTLDQAADGLDEVNLTYSSAASGPDLNNEACDGHSIPGNMQESENEDLTEDGTENIGTEKSNGRTHFLTIRGEDRARLFPGEFLNDTLIDFWMQWIWRKEKEAGASESSVHFFTSHFFTTLSEEGPAGVASWTAKKGIDIFSKRLVFIPINKSLHWSLCVVVNPGAIENRLVEDERVHGDDVPFPCILFFDSLKAHRKNHVAMVVRGWLNAEWKRLGKPAKSGESPFKQKNMEVFDPRIPYQDNSCDCGVFVCRYGLNMYLCRNEPFTYGDFDEEFRDAVTKHSLFQFGMGEIGQLRDEIATLVDRLSKTYKKWKTEQDRKAQEEKKARAERKKARVAEENALKEASVSQGKDEGYHI